jgi:imidazolonepropionase-like amidohydrolase
VQIAIQSGRDGFGESQPRNLPFMAGVAVAYGLPYLEALKAITINPAKILGIDNEVGSLEVGKAADVVVFDGDPLEPRSKVLHVFIAGEEIPLRSYQNDLYEKYR